MSRRLGCDPTTGALGASGGAAPVVAEEFLVPFGTVNPVVTTGSFPQLGFGDIIITPGNQAGLITVPFNGVAEVLVVRHSRPLAFNPTAITYRVYRNLSPTGMFVSMQAQTATAVVDAVNTFSVALGDTLSLFAQTVGANVVPIPCAALVVRPN